VSDDTKAKDEDAKPAPKAKAKRTTRRKDTGEARQYPDQKGLRQIETERPNRDELSPDQAKSIETRERTGWKPQSEPSKPFPSWWETPEKSSQA